MKKILISFSVLFSLTASAQNKFLSFTDGYVNTADFEVNKTISESSSYIDVTYTFEGGTIHNVKGNNKTYQAISMPNALTSAERGNPELPYFEDVFAIGSLSNVKVSVVSSEYKDIANVYVCPSLGENITGSNVDFPKENQVYTTNKFFPSTITSIEGKETFRSVPLATVRINPVQFNPVTKKLRCYKRVTYRLQFTSGKTNLNLPNTIKEVLKSKVSNPDCIDKHSTSSLKAATAVTPDIYLILTTNDYKSAVQKFIKWKSMQGFECMVKYVDGKTTDQIKSLLKTIYQSSNGNRIAYLTIVGDHKDVPGIEVIIRHNRDDLSTNPVILFTDNLYANTTYITNGDTITHFNTTNADSYNLRPDVVTGRISVSTLAEANTVVDKIIKYEKTPPTDYNFYRKSVHCGYYEDKYRDGRYDGYADNDFAESTFNSYNTVVNNSDISINRVYTASSYGSDVLPKDSWLPSEYKSSWNMWYTSSQAGTRITNAINSGILYALYGGHGSSSGWASCGFYSSNAASMTNGDKLPFLFGGITCHSGTYKDACCFTETMLRKSNGGAIGVTGNSAWGWSSLSTARSEALFTDIFQNGNNMVGNAFNAKWFINLYNNNKYPYKTHIQLSAHYFGDPNLMFYTQEPICFHPTVSKSGTSVTVNTNGVADCKITLTSSADPTNVSRMKVMTGDNVTFTNVNYPYVITIQKNNYAPCIIDDIYVQNYNVYAKTIAGYNIYAGESVTTTTPNYGNSNVGAVTVMSGPTVFKAKNKVVMKKGFNVKQGVSFRAYTEGACNYGGVERTNTVRSSNGINTEYILLDEEIELDDILSDEDQKVKVHVFPNPTDGIFNVSLDNKDLTFDVRITNVSGQVIKTYNRVNGQAECDITDLPAGIYFVQVNEQFTAKIMKK